MNMSTNHSTKNPSYSPLSASERGEISAYLKMGKKTAEIARLFGVTDLQSVEKSDVLQ